MPILAATNAVALTIAVVGLVGLLIFYGLIGPSFSLLLHCRLVGVRVTIADLIGMRFRKVDARAVVLNLIICHKAHVRVELAQLEAHTLAGGRTTEVVRALVMAKKARLPITFEEIAGMDLAGEDVLEFVSAAVQELNEPQPKPMP